MNDDADQEVLFELQGSDENSFIVRPASNFRLAVEPR